MKSKRKLIIIFAAVVVLLVFFGAAFGGQKANAGKGSYYEKGEDGRIYYYGEGNDPTVQMIVTPVPGKENMLFEETENRR
ncbi:MAG: hypothetical protein J1E35_03965 [Lachnospiraceae bacterium]|nr:hypothetical protein [Lachnospiraceae bacterium]